MHFPSTISVMAAGLSLLTATATAYYLPFQGEGILYVLSSFDDKILGCLAEDGKWTTGDVTECAINKALGDGFIRDGSDSYYASYYLTVNDNHVITTITDYGGKAVAAWDATEDIDTYPSMIVANAGDLGNGGGGPFWYAASAASGADTVELSAVPLEGDQVQNVTLVWADYDKLQSDLASQNQ